MSDQTPQVILTFNAGPEADAEDLETLTRQLREELLDLDDIEAVDLARVGVMPEQAKGGDPVEWGTLLLTLAASGGVLTTLINVLPSLLKRQEQLSATLEIGGDKLVMTGISSQDQRRLIDAWLSRQQDFHATPLEPEQKETQSVSEMAHNSFETIHAYLAGTFTDEGLRRFCYDTPEFAPVYEQLEPNTDKGIIIERLIQLAHQKAQIRKLLTLAKAYSTSKKS